MEEFQHLKIQLKDILSITEEFDDKNLIGRGGFGPVYRGELSLPDRKSMVAFKRLDRSLGQGNTEFWKEIVMLSKYRHDNLVSLLHFCDEGDERILVYEYISRGSLDRYLSVPDLTWIHRLEICIGAARAINYLHDPVGTQQRVLHRDIKSSNILLDVNWRAKVSDFGLAKVSPANQPQTFVVSNVVGTPGYCDPLYWAMGYLTKESDVYSFGVVLFEVLSGKLCCEYRNGELISFLVQTWKTCDEKRLEDIVFPNMYQNMDMDSLMTFYTIARRCLNDNRKERPTMAEIVTKLEVAREQQKLFVSGQKFSIGKNKPGSILVAGKAHWVWQEDKCIWKSISDSRYNMVVEFYNHHIVTVTFKIIGELLSPQKPYSCNIIYKIPDFHNPRNSRTPISDSHVIRKSYNKAHTRKLDGHMTFRPDGWMEVQFWELSLTSTEPFEMHVELTVDDNRKEVNFAGLKVQGIELRPL